MADQPTPLDQMLNIYAVNTGKQYGPQAPIGLDDPTQLIERYRSALNLTPAEVQQLSVPQAQGGPSLQDRIQALRPNVNLGRLNLSTDGHRVQGRMRF